MRLNHLHIKTQHLEETRRFYQKYFGFSKAFDHEEATFLMDDNGFLLAILPYGKDEAPFTFPEWFHFGFCLEEESSVRDLYARMRADRVELARPLKEFEDGTVNFYCLDPAGYKVEVSWNQEEAQILRRRQLIASSCR